MPSPNYAPRAFPDAETRKALQKPRPRLLDKRKQESERDRIDREERAKCHVRSGGWCEVYEQVPGRRVWLRCGRRVAENHHLIGGRMRNRGKSILMAHRLDTCSRCHEDITGNVLKPVDAIKRYEAATVRYERVR
jgi:hypothetical protein